MWDTERIEVSDKLQVMQLWGREGVTWQEHIGCGSGASLQGEPIWKNTNSLRYFSASCSMQGTSKGRTFSFSLPEDCGRHTVNRGSNKGNNGNNDSLNSWCLPNASYCCRHNTKLSYWHMWSSDTKYFHYPVLCKKTLRHGIVHLSDFHRLTQLDKTRQSCCMLGHWQVLQSPRTPIQMKEMGLCLVTHHNWTIQGQEGWDSTHWLISTVSQILW